MRLKALLDSASYDVLDEAIKAAYTERDGKFYLNVDGLQEHPDALGLKSALTKARQEKKDAETKLAELQERFAGVPDDLTGDDIVASLDRGGGKVDQRLAEQRERLTKQYDSKLNEAKEQLQKATARADRLYSENALMSAMTEANITLPHAQKAVKAMLRDQIKVEYEGDEVVVTIDNMPVADKVKAYAQSDEGKYFVTAPNNSGGGSGGQGGSTATDYSKKSITELALLEGKDPLAKAEIERRTKIEKPAAR
ncbi:hypothetical protein K3G63_04665 [Hymenobacter sp. HSC-4F20]|uniref:hypothetical protein n=1 Tax=Hymenobacter sp. HSC-4F20 TaxID=2864135 RepID=UPI001C73AF05|nr:hypothetical protein [Hymenobacter sp. HSC-4F20]MBX0289716.1 hypothetical protein [Hymenobacter sp. HSC-4F20]